VLRVQGKKPEIQSITTRLFACGPGGDAAERCAEEPNRGGGVEEGGRKRAGEETVREEERGGWENEWMDG